MFYKKPGFPEEGELLLCTVKKVLYHCVFVDLDEYQNLEGMIHISEIAPGRIRNIRDYVKEDKKIICKVLKIDQQRKQIDLSLRRVSPSVRKKKSSEYQQEQKSERILELVALKLKTEIKDVYEKIGYAIIEEYGSLNVCFQLVIKKETNLKELKLPEKYLKTLLEIIEEKIRLPEITIKSVLSLSSTLPNGIDAIKDVLARIKNIAKEKKYSLKLSYISAPRYSLSITASDYKSAEKALRELTEEAIKLIKSKGGQGESQKSA